HLLDAIVKAELCEDAKSTYISRSSRTDTGVSAAVMVVSVMMRYKKEGDEAGAGIADLINALMPKDIRVMKCHRVTKNFDGRKLCHARHYSYYLPLAVLDPATTGITDSNAETLADKWAEHREWRQDMPDEDREEMLKHGLFKEGDDTLYDGKRPSFKECPFGSEDEERARRILAEFNGSNHLYHNYTQKMKIGDGKARRVLYSVTTQGVVYLPAPEVEGVDTESIAGVEYREVDGETKAVIPHLRITLHGQSFLMYMIRRMIATFVLVYRGELPIEWMRVSLAKHFVPVPTAPGNGLMLDRGDFTPYNKRFPSHTPIDTELALTEAQGFMEAEILPTFPREEATNDKKAWRTYERHIRDWLMNKDESFEDARVVAMEECRRERLKEGRRSGKSLSLPQDMKYNLRQSSHNN
ncbi:pseudouridine synthase I, TruA, partial [Kipferlia bialata]